MYLTQQFLLLLLLLLLLLVVMVPTIGVASHWRSFV
jgi:hypothetical protein